jgi:pectin methylesterase-like acyl-CoA thioesterase
MTIERGCRAVQQMDVCYRVLRRSAATPGRFHWFSLVLRCLWVAAICLRFCAQCFADLTLTDKWPADAAVPVDAPLRLTFNEAPVLGERGKIGVSLAKTGEKVATVDLEKHEFVDRFGAHGGYYLRYEPVHVAGNTATIRLPSLALKNDETYRVRIEPGVLKDTAGHDFAGVGEQWEFRTKPPPARNADRYTVRADGTADFCTVQGAVDRVEPHRDKPIEIFVGKGTYEEMIRVQREKVKVHLIGEDRKQTVIQYLNNDKLNPGWIQRSVFGVEADDFVLENLTVRNTTLYKGSQAEAVYVNAERCTLRNADFLSFQDTLNLNGSVFVKDCYVEGDVDFVWGYGAVFFENCELRAVHDGYYVQSRNTVAQPGFVFVRCKLTAAPEVKNCWLARIETNRFPGSQVAFIHCEMGAHVPPAAWSVKGPPSEQLRFQEFGTSSSADKRPLDLTRRSPAAKQLKSDEADALSKPEKTLNGWSLGSGAN